MGFSLVFGMYLPQAVAGYFSPTPADVQAAGYAAFHAATFIELFCCGAKGG
jgi:hypothetical protein